MKVRHTLICFFFLSAVQDGNNGRNVYTRTEGGDVTVQCPSSSYSRSRKFLCKDSYEQEDVIIETTDASAQKGRFSIKWSGDVSVTIKQLTKSDSGWYRCGSKSLFQEFEILVVDALLDGGYSEGTTFYPRPGGNILVGCSFGITGTRSYFCEGICERKDILVETTAYEAQSDRYSIRYVKSSPSRGFVYVRITQLTRSDSGRYRSGLYNPRYSPDWYCGFEIVVTDAPTTSEPNQAMTSSVPSASTATTTQSLSSSSGSSRASPASPENINNEQSDTASTTRCESVWLYAVIVVVVIVSGLVLMIFCIWRNIKPDGLNTSRTSGGTNTEIALYENCGPVSTCEDSTYQSLHPASRDQDQTYSTLTHTQYA